jgi:transcriptional regulator with XRE-family HTH domain
MIDFRKLREFRIGRGLTQSELAARADYTYDSISGIERGLKDPSLLHFQNLCKALQLDPIELMDLLKYWPIPYKLLRRFRVACKREDTTVLQALIDFMEVYCAE